jgi:capsular polysaccharide biosynthesis protein
MSVYSRNSKPDLASAAGGSSAGPALLPLAPLSTGTSGGSSLVAASVNAAASAGAAADAHRRNPLLVLWNRRWIIVSCLLIALAAGIIRLKLAIQVYESTAQVTIEQNTPRIISNDPSGMMVSSTQNFLWTQCTVIKSRDFLRTVVSEPGIRELPSFGPGEDPAGRLAGMVDANVGRRDDVITVSVRSIFKEDARQIADAVVTSFVKYREGTSRSKARELLDILQNTKVQSDREVAQKRRRCSTSRLKTPPSRSEPSAGPIRRSTGCPDSLLHSPRRSSRR